MSYNLAILDKLLIKVIQKIKQTANQCREKLINYTNEFIIQIENKLNELAKQLEQSRNKNKFNEIDLKQLKKSFFFIKTNLKNCFLKKKFYFVD